MSKVFFTLTIAFLILGKGQAQQINYSVITDAPEFDKIPNLYITPYPLLSMDFPMWGPNPDAMSSAAVFGLGLRSHAVLGNKLHADFNFHQGVWLGKTRHIDIGGAMILKSRVKEKNINVVISRKETGRERYNDKVVVSESVKYIAVPGKELKFLGIRGGVTHYNSVFEFTEGSYDWSIMGFRGAEGTTNSFGIYGGLTWGNVRNLHIKLKDGKERNHAQYQRWYLDGLLVVHNHNYIYNTANKTVLPFGFRIGRDIYSPSKGILGTFTNLEAGYRPGYDGLYIKMGVTFIQIRQQVAGLQSITILKDKNE